jgi:hypothetical protein
LENFVANSGSIVSGTLRLILFGCKKEVVTLFFDAYDDGNGWIRGGILLACCFFSISPKVIVEVFGSDGGG